MSLNELVKNLNGEGKEANDTLKKILDAIQALQGTGGGHGNGLGRLIGASYIGSRLAGGAGSGRLFSTGVSGNNATTAAATVMQALRPYPGVSSPSTVEESAAPGDDATATAVKPKKKKPKPKKPGLKIVYPSVTATPIAAKGVDMGYDFENGDTTGVSVEKPYPKNISAFPKNYVRRGNWASMNSMTGSQSMVSAPNVNVRGRNAKGHFLPKVVATPVEPAVPVDPDIKAGQQDLINAVNGSKPGWKSWFSQQVGGSKNGASRAGKGALAGVAAYQLLLNASMPGDSGVYSNVAGYNKILTDTGEAMKSASTYLLYAPLTALGLFGGIGKGVM